MFKFFQKSAVPSPRPTAPFNEQDMVVGMLRNDPRIMSHVWGAQIYDLQRIERDDARAQQLINDIFEDISKRFGHDPECLSRILRTMLKTYRVDVDVTQVPAVEKIYNIVCDYVKSHYRDIQVYA